MTYRFLTPPLHPVAEAVRKFLTEEWGIGSAKIAVEQPISDDVGIVPTLHAQERDHSLICIEVSETPYPPQLDSLVVDCLNAALPVKIYVAIPTRDNLPQKEIVRAGQRGVGVLVVGSDCKIMNRALNLSLTGVRKPDTSAFVQRHRKAVADAYVTFVQGDPAKGCADVYEEIEALARRIAVKVSSKNAWKASAPAPPNAADPRVSLNRIAKFLLDHFDPNVAKTPQLDHYLLGRVVGIVGHRNATAHKPASLKALKKRDAELRTRFETAIDVFRDLASAAAPLRV
jgi:hypothetical protein